MARRSPHSVQHGREDSYLRMVRAFPLRPIRSESELDRAIEVIDSLIAKEDLDSGQEDYLDVLGDLVHKYEAEHDPMVAVSDTDMVRFLLESNEMAQTELAQRSGITESTISDHRIDDLGNPGGETKAEPSPYRVAFQTLPREPCGLLPRSGRDYTRMSREDHKSPQWTGTLARPIGFSRQRLRMRLRSCLLACLPRTGRWRQPRNAYRCDGKSMEFLVAAAWREQLLVARDFRFDGGGRPSPRRRLLLRKGRITRR